MPRHDLNESGDTRLRVSDVRPLSFFRLVLRGAGAGVVASSNGWGCKVVVIGSP
ncbi:hypothetical protein GCM10009744_31010 [Kribbella alba]|uniref:Uncharacterized protein n=1 Tax=Kribbella alba TaxID=190197 RepID=A0ABN2FBI3_9ACTN